MSSADQDSKRDRPARAAAPSAGSQKKQRSSSSSSSSSSGHHTSSFSHGDGGGEERDATVTPSFGDPIIDDHDHLSRLQSELLLAVLTEHLRPTTLPELSALASISRLFRKIVYTGCGEVFWKDLCFHRLEDDDDDDEAYCQYGNKPKKELLIPPELTEKFTDADLRRFLENANAKEVTRSIQLAVGQSIGGHGLAPIAGSRALVNLTVRSDDKYDCFQPTPTPVDYVELSRLLDSYFLDENESFDPQHGFRLNKTEVRVCVTFGKQDEFDALSTATERLRARMKQYWTPEKVTCSYCEGLIRKAGLIDDSFENSGRKVAEVRPDWVCISCYRPSCGRGSCPNILPCAAEMYCLPLPGPFCTACEPFKKCSCCDRGLCARCVDYCKCHSCGSMYCGQPRAEDIEACLTAECEMCHYVFCSKAKCEVHYCEDCEVQLCGSCGSWSTSQDRITCGNH